MTAVRLEELLRQALCGDGDARLGRRITSLDVLDALPARIAYIDAQERYRVVNRACLELSGTDRASMLGMTVREALGEAFYREVRDVVGQALRGEPVVRHMTFQSLGRARRALVTCTPNVLPDGTVDGVYVMSVDLMTPAG